MAGQNRTMYGWLGQGKKPGLYFRNQREGFRAQFGKMWEVVSFSLRTILFQAGCPNKLGSMNFPTIVKLHPIVSHPQTLDLHPVQNSLVPILPGMICVRAQQDENTSRSPLQKVEPPPRIRTLHLQESSQSGSQYNLTLSLSGSHQFGGLHAHLI